MSSMTISFFLLRWYSYSSILLPVTPTLATLSSLVVVILMKWQSEKLAQIGEIIGWNYNCDELYSKVVKIVPSCNRGEGSQSSQKRDKNIEWPHDIKRHQVSWWFRKDYVLYGCEIVGLGLGIAYLPAMISVSFYFEKRRTLATGMALCGTGIGTFIFAPLTNMLLSEYAWKGTVLIHGGMNHPQQHHRWYGIPSFEGFEEATSGGNCGISRG